MALFKIFRGDSTKLGQKPSAEDIAAGKADTRYAHEGYAYFTSDDGKFYIDIEGRSDDNNTSAISTYMAAGRNRIAINAEKADRDSEGHIIKDTYAADLDIQGHSLTLVNGAENIISDSAVTLPDELVKQTAKTNNGEYKILTTSTTSPTSGAAAQAAYDSGVTINPSTHTITATNFVGEVQGNASTATTLQTARNINGTAFDGSSNITTSSWGTARNVVIKDADQTNSGSAVSVDGSAAVNLLLPSTIKATLTGNASTATNATNDSDGNAINATYVKEVSWDNATKTLSRTKGGTAANPTTTSVLQFAAGSNASLSASSGVLTIAAIDEKVKQTNDSTNATQRILFNGTNNDEETSSVKKSADLTFNPSTKTLTTHDLTLNNNLFVNGQTTLKVPLVNGSYIFPKLYDGPGAPSIPTNSNDKTLATTEFVMHAFTANDAMVFKGLVVDGNPQSVGYIAEDIPNGVYHDLPVEHEVGWTFKVAYDGFIMDYDNDSSTAHTCYIGDTIYCVNKSEPNATANVQGDWVVIQGNIEGVVFKGANDFTDGQVIVAQGTSGLVKCSGLTINPTGEQNRLAYYNNANNITHAPKIYVSADSTTSDCKMAINATNTLSDEKLFVDGNTYIKGNIRLYKDTTKYTTISRQSSDTNTNRTFYLPIYAGDAYAVHASSNTAVGSSTQPVYVATNGRVTALTYTQNRLYYSASSDSFTYTNHYADTDHVAVHNTTLPSDTTFSNTAGSPELYVNGNTKIYGKVAEGDSTKAYGSYSHAEGKSTQTIADYSHAEGLSTSATGAQAHAENNDTIAHGSASHAEGFYTAAYGTNAHAEGAGRIENGNEAVSITITVVANSDNKQYTCSSTSNLKVGRFLRYNNTVRKITAINNNTVTIDAAFQENGSAIGLNNQEVTIMTGAGGNNSHAEGVQTIASGGGSHAEGYQTIASGAYAHAEGQETTASGLFAHTEGYRNSALIARSGTIKLTTSSSNTYTYTNASFTPAVCDILFYNNEMRIIQSVNTTNTTLTTDTAFPTSLSATSVNLYRGGFSAHAEGRSTAAFGPFSHVEGSGTGSAGMNSHSEGYYTRAYGTNAHAEGGGGANSATISVVTGTGNKTFSSTATNIKDYFKVGCVLLAVINGVYEYRRIVSSNIDNSPIQFTIDRAFTTTPSGSFSATFYTCAASGNNSHVEGLGTKAYGSYSHAEGSLNLSVGPASHTEGQNNIAYGAQSHVEGVSNIAGDIADITLTSTATTGQYSYVCSIVPLTHDTIVLNENYYTISAIDTTNNILTTSNLGTLNGNIATLLRCSYAHAEGSATKALSHSAHAEGRATTASGSYSHAEGYGSTASGNYSHAEGYQTNAEGIRSHTEGDNTHTTIRAAHAEGLNTTASGIAAHAEGNGTTASTGAAHAEGLNTEASGSYSHAEGQGTIANHRSQHVFGEYNIADPSTATADNLGNYAEIVGNGTSSTQKNARTLNWNGCETLYPTTGNNGVAFNVVHSAALSNGQVFHAIKSINSGMGQGSWVRATLGQNESNLNCGYLGFYYAGASNNSNMMTLGVMGSGGGFFRAYANGNFAIGSHNASYKLYVDGTLYANGNTTIAGNLNPSATNAKDLGTSSLYWNNGYIKKLYSTSGAANTMAWFDSSRGLQGSSHRVDGSHVAICSTDQPSSNFYVNGSSIFNIGSSNAVTNKRFIINGNDSYYLSFGAQGVQAYSGAPSTTTASILYLNYGSGGNVLIGKDNTTTVGIATTSPSSTYRLHVNGKGYFADDIWTGSTSTADEIDIGIDTVAGRIFMYAGNTTGSGKGIYIKSAGGTNSGGITWNQSNQISQITSFATNILPATSLGYGLGSSSYYWKAFLGQGGAFHLDNLRMTTQPASSSTDNYRTGNSIGAYSFLQNGAQGNKLYGIVPEAITVEYTNNGNATTPTWTVSTAVTDRKKMNWFTGENPAAADTYASPGNAYKFDAGSSTTQTVAAGKGVRVTVDLSVEHRTGFISMITMGVYNRGSTCKLTVEKYNTNQNVWTTIFTRQSNDLNDAITAYLPSLLEMYGANSHSSLQRANKLRWTYVIVTAGAASRYGPALAWASGWGYGAMSCNINATYKGSRSSWCIARYGWPFFINERNVRGTVVEFDCDLVPRQHVTVTAAESTTNIHNIGTSSRKWANVYATKVYGGVWNDYAEFRSTDVDIEPGRCVKENGKDSLELTTERLERGCEIVSDTYGFGIGESDNCKTPIASSGRVLAYPYESREEFAKHIGWPVCSGPEGTVSLMTEEEEEKYPSRIIGTVSSVPDYEQWGDTAVEVNGRVWIRIR